MCPSLTDHYTPYLQSQYIYAKDGTFFIVFIYTIGYIHFKPNLYGDKVQLLKISEHRYDIDINTEKDWSVAEAIFGFTENLERF